MTSERWRKIEELYHVAQARDPKERSAFLTEAYQGDAELQRQIEALLARDTDGQILDGRAAELLSDTTESPNAKSLSAGDKLGPYEIVAFIVPEVYLSPFLPGAPGGPAGPEARVSTAGGAAPLLRKDGRELFYLQHGTLMAVDVKLGTPPEIGVPHKLFDAPIAESHHYAVFGDGQRFLFTEPAGEPPTAKINVVVNWAAGLKQ